MITAIEVVAPCRLLSMNDRVHHLQRARDVAAWRTAGYLAACELGAPSRRSRPPCHVRMRLPVPDRRKRDAHNYYPTVKAIIDGLVQAKVWPDDDGGWVTTEEPVLEVVADGHRGPPVAVVELVPELHHHTVARRVELAIAVLDDHATRPDELRTAAAPGTLVAVEQVLRGRV